MLDTLISLLIAAATALPAVVITACLWFVVTAVGGGIEEETRNRNR